MKTDLFVSDEKNMGSITFDLSGLEPGRYEYDLSIMEGSKRITILTGDLTMRKKRRKSKAKQ